MEEEELINNLLTKNKTGVMGIITLIATVLFFLLRWVRVLVNAFKLLKTERLFESYNNRVGLAAEKKVTYNFKPLTLKKDSQEIFDIMRYAYDIESATKVDGKTISFKMFELVEDEILLSNITRFLDYYRTKNGVKILIFLQGSNESNCKEHLSNHIERLNIRGAKII